MSAWHFCQIHILMSRENVGLAFCQITFQTTFPDLKTGKGKRRNRMASRHSLGHVSYCHSHAGTESGKQIQIHNDVHLVYWHRSVRFRESAQQQEIHWEQGHPNSLQGGGAMASQQSCYCHASVDNMFTEKREALLYCNTPTQHNCRQSLCISQVSAGQKKIKFSVARLNNSLIIEDDSVRCQRCRG